MKRLKNKKANATPSVVSVLFIIFNLLFLWYIKYKFHGLEREEFRFGYIGNIFNLIFAIILITGIIVNYFAKIKTKDSGLLIYSILLTVFLSGGALSNYFQLPYHHIYFFDHPLPEVFTGFLFLCFQLLQFIFISVLWIKIIGGKELIFLNASVNGVILFLLLFFFAFFYLNRNVKLNQITSSKNNVVVVLGAAVWSRNIPSPSLAARIDKAAKLLKAGTAEIIQLTGSNAPGELSEAKVAYRRLLEKGVDSTKIWMEERTTSTNEQVRFIKQDLISRKKINNIIIVSDSYHLTRVNEICQFYNVQADIHASDLNLRFDNKIYHKLKESIALVLFWLFAL